MINSIYRQILSRMRYCMHYVMHDMHANGVIYSVGQYVVWDDMQNKIQSRTTKALLNDFSGNNFFRRKLSPESDSASGAAAL